MSARLTDGDICNLPKTDLHRHVDGAIKPELLFRLANELGVKLPTDNLAEFKKLYQIVEAGMSVPEILQRFCWAIAVMRTPEGLFKVFRQQIHDLKHENILYAELRFAPGYCGKYKPSWYKPEMYEEKPFPGMSLGHAVRCALAGIEQGMRETGITVNLILCIDRESLFPPKGHGPQSVIAIRDLGLRFQRDVVGLDLACNETLYPPDPYIPYFLPLLGSNLGCSPHAGEMGEKKQKKKNIVTCIKEIDARIKKRLGHAIDLWESEEQMGVCREQNIGIERVPCTPMPGCKLEDGHLDVLLEHKVPVAIVSDDPVLMQKSLTDNWLAVRDYHDFGVEEFWQLTANAVNTGFYRNEDQKKMVRDMFVKRGLSRSLLR